MLIRLTIFLLTAILTSFTYLDGSALAGLLGDRIRPYLSVREVYDDNIFRVRDEGQLQSSVEYLSDMISLPDSASMLSSERMMWTSHFQS